MLICYTPNIMVQQTTYHPIIPKVTYSVKL